MNFKHDIFTYAGSKISLNYSSEKLNIIINESVMEIKALEYAKQIAYSSEETLVFTYETAKKLKDLPGCFCECGVAAGAQIIAMAAGAPKKKIFAFDSFQGLPWPSNKDDQMPGIKYLSPEEIAVLPNPDDVILESSGATVVSQKDFWNHIIESGVPFLNITAIEGWFENTVQNFNEPIALLRLDGDLYNSTKVCLEHLYPKVVSGGMVIIDDIQLSGCRQAVYDYFRGVKIDIQTIGTPQNHIGYFYKES